MTIASAIEAQPTPAPSLAQLIPMYQAMQAALMMPPSPQLTKIVTDTLERTTDPMMKGFLNLLITGDQGHRDLAAQIFNQLEQKVVQARQAQQLAAAEQAKALVEASPLVETYVKSLGTPTAPVLVEGVEQGQGNVEAASQWENFDEAMSHWQRRSADLQREHAQDDLSSTLEEPADNVVSLPERQRESTIVPYADERGERYTLRYSDKDGTVTKEEIYSIITENTAFELSPELALHQLRGVIIGVKGQTTVEHGFGYVLPLEGMDFLPSDRSLHIPIRLEYPTAMPLYDDHNAANVEGLKEFMAIHETLSKGYTVCLDLYVKVNAHPSNGQRFSLTVRQEKLILRRQVQNNGYGPDGAMFSSADLEDLHSATKKLSLVGIFATRTL